MTLAWTDIPVKDLDRAIGFYSAVLGIPINKVAVRGQTVGLLPAEEGAAGGCLAPADGTFQPATWGPLLYLNCNGRLEAAQEAVEPHGGKVVQSRHVVLGAGYRSIVVDSEGNRVALLSDGVDRAIAKAERAAADQPDAPMAQVRLAERVAGQGHAVQAYQVCKKVFPTQDPDVDLAARRLLSTLVPGYHVPMMNDPRRSGAWDKVLRRAIKPGMHVLEIGTGPGLLAMQAARAGAGRVTTCEYHPVVAAVARDIVALNGLEDRIKVLSKSSLKLQVGVDMDTRADLMFCDNFSDNMFSFQPLQSIADARARLLSPGAPAIPAAAAVRVALARWGSYQRFFNTDHSFGFDLGSLTPFVPESVDFELGDAGFELVSDDHDLFRFDFSAADYPEGETVEVDVHAARAGLIHGIAQWIRLELDADTVLEARPEPGAQFFSNPRFYPFPRPLEVQAGDAVRIHARHDSKTLTIYRRKP